MQRHVRKNVQMIIARKIALKKNYCQTNFLFLEDWLAVRLFFHFRLHFVCRKTHARLQAVTYVHHTYYYPYFHGKISQQQRQ